MEILTALQWAKKGFIPNEGAKGTKQWTNSLNYCLGVRQSPFRRLCGSRHTSVQNPFGRWCTDG